MAPPPPVARGPGPYPPAAAPRLGVPTQRLRRGDPVRPTRGVRALTVPATLVERATAFQAGMPTDRAFSHLTAAVLWGLPLTATLEESAAADGAPLHVVAPTADGCAVRRGVVGHRGLEVRGVGTPPGTGLRVVDLADTWCDLGELPRGTLTLHDLVVAGDAAVALLDARAGRAVGVHALHAALARRNRPRGAVALRHALTLVRARVRSPMETRARLMFVDAGFPEPEVNAPLTDAAGGVAGRG